MEELIRMLMGTGLIDEDIVISNQKKALHRILVNDGYVALKKDEDFLDESMEQFKREYGEGLVFVDNDDFYYIIGSRKGAETLTRNLGEGIEKGEEMIRGMKNLKKSFEESDAIKRLPRLYIGQKEGD